jgi:outer membrane protein, multidrug efflux system
MMHKKHITVSKFLSIVSAGFPMALLLLICTGCRVGPEYKTPDINVPGRFGSTLQDEEPNVSGDLSQWWTTLDDPMLDSLVNEVMLGNLDIKLAGDRIEQAQAIRGIITGSDKPQVNMTGTAMRESYSLNSLFGPFLQNRIEDDYIGAFNARWELDFFGKTSRGVEGANAGIEAARENRRAVIVAMSASVAKGYIIVRQLQNQLDVANKNMRIQQDIFDSAQQRFNAGLINELVLQQAKAQLEATRSILPRLDTSLQQAIHRIGILTGNEPKVLENKLMTGGSIPATKPMIPIGLPSELLTRRPDIVRAERNLAAATANIGFATADMFPRFSLTGALGHESISADLFSSSDSRYWTLASGFSWPIFNWGTIRANIRLQDAKQQEAMDLYIKSILIALEDVENALIAYGNEQQRLSLLETQNSASLRAAALAQERYENGLVDFLNVLDAQRQLYQSEDALAVSRGQLAINLVALYESLGGGWDRKQQ